VAAGLCRRAATGASDVLDEVAAALDEGRPVDTARLDTARARVRRAAERLESGSAGGTLTARAASARLRVLAGQLRAVLEVVTTGASEGREPEPADVRRRAMLRDPIAIVKANITFDSAVLRHAARAALLIGGSDLVVRVAGYAHGYWVPLTALMVLRPDFSTTFQRAAMRVAGTIAGLLLASVLLYWAVPDGEWYYIALVALFFFAMRMSGPTNLLLSAAAVSALLVVLLALNGASPRDTVVDRTIATAIGGALAVLATLLFPLWERDVLPVRLADLIAAYRSYLLVIADPKSTASQRRQSRAAGRLARTNAQASFDRVRNDAVAAPGMGDLGESVLANAHRAVHALMTFDSMRDQVPRSTELDDLLQAADVSLQSAEAALRGRETRPAGELRAVQERLHAALTRDPDRFGGSDAAGAIDDASDRLANAVDTLLAGIRRNSRKIAAIPSMQ
jgi:uncharacterized membrane protein YccC